MELEFKYKKILITGGTGFLGCHLLKQLMLEDNNYEIALVVREKKTGIEDNIQQLVFNNNYNEFEQQLISFAPEIVIHLASFLTANDHYEVIDKIIDSNITFGTKLLQALSKTKFKYFINTGSFAEYYSNDGHLDAAYLYAASKSAFRHILNYYEKKLKFKTINVIPFTIYGEDDNNKKIMDYIVESLENPKAIEMTSGAQVLDFIHVKDVANFYIQLINNTSKITDNCNEFQVGTGIGTTKKELSAIIEEQANKKANILWGARDYRERDVMKAVADIPNTQKLMNWKAKITLENGINSLLISQGVISENH